MSLVLDASVVAKWFNNEELTEKAVEFKQALVEGQVEFAAAMHIHMEKLSARREGRPGRHRLAHATGFGTSRTIHQAKRKDCGIARARRTTFYDAAYLQDAEELKRPLLTADQLQVASARGITKAIHLREAKLWDRLK